MSNARSIAFNSIWATAWIKAIRPAGLVILRFGTSRGGSKAGRSGRAGRWGGARPGPKGAPDRKASPTASAAAHLSAGAAVSNTSTVRSRMLRAPMIGLVEGFDGFEHRFNMAWHANFAPNLANDPGPVD